MEGKDATKDGAMYTIESRIRYSECDGNGVLSLLGLINYLQDATTFHSEDIGRGVGYMVARGQAWLIAAWQIEIGRLPRFCERIRVNTWCHTMTHTLASRNFVLRDEAGTPLVRADSLWFVYDSVAGRAIRIPDDQLVFLSDEAPLDLPPTKRRLPVTGDYACAPAVTVGELHLDSNRHVNNAQYLGMAVDAIVALQGDQEAATTDAIRRICVQYKRQAHLGDVIVPRVHEAAGVCTVDLAAEEGDSYAVVRIETRD